MRLRILIALSGLALSTAIGTASGQVPIGREAIPTRRALARVDLDLQFASVVPLNGAEKLVALSIDDGMMFAQTNSANFYAFDAETGRFLWGANLGRVTTRAEHAAVNKQFVFASNSNKIYALDRNLGRQVWMQDLTDIPTSGTAAGDKEVVVGTASGKLECFDAATGRIRWNIQSNARVSARPIVADKLVAFGSEDRRVYMSKIDKPELIWRFVSGGPLLAPLGSHGVRTLLVPATDRSLYALDLFTGEVKWNVPTGSSVSQEPLVTDDDVYIVNEEGNMSSIDAISGKTKWTISTLGGRLISVSGTKVYLESHDEDLFVVDRATGRIIHDPVSTFSRAGINLRNYPLGPTNRFDDRLYFGTTHGLIVCFREIGQVAPRTLRDPKSKPFGYIPPEGYPDAPPPIPTAPVADPNAPVDAGTATPPG